MQTNRLVIDTSVYINYCTHNKLYRLMLAIDRYDITVFINQELIRELQNNIVSALKTSDTNASLLLEAILEAAHFFETIPLFTSSPDPKDNFLFDLALQTNSRVIVTQEKALLNFKNSPVPVHDIKWFKESFPVPL